MFNKILIANRGEIACRIIKTAKKMGIKTVAIYSTADIQSQHVKLADEAYCVGHPAAAESYLNQKRILEIAKETQSEAIHPGYGFLAENADFAQLCQQNEIVFIGPSDSAIRKMGDKARAKKIMQENHVTTTPGYDGDDQSVEKLKQAADEINYPVLIKAAAGGGGKGMRLVENKKAFEHALTSAKREAKSSFGNDHVILEKYCSFARHVEVQLFADKQGNIIYLFDRDCSVQRRHQKIIEEAPAPNISDELRKKMGEAAVNAARAIHYTGAGTVEFLLTKNELSQEFDTFYFMEMNTRLQVEHPVTEMITGIDLVEWQIKIAHGEPLPLKQNELTITGHAIEARICAENPDDDFKPSIGKLHYFHTPNQNEHLRIDTGVKEGDSISPYYDSMIAKIIAHGHDRETTLATLKQALSDTLIIGVDTNTQYCYRVLNSSAFHHALLSTRFIEMNQHDLADNDSHINIVAFQIAASAEYHYQKNKTKKLAEKSSDDKSPWFYADNFRLNSVANQTITLWHNSESVALQIHQLQNQYHLQYGFNHYVIEIEWNNGYSFTAIINKEIINGNAIRYDNKWYLFYQGRKVILFSHNPITENEFAGDNNTALTAPMPGTVIDVLVKPGESVKVGQRLMIIEAMKMEHAIVANTDGVITTVYFKPGDSLAEGELLFSLEKNE